MDSDRYFGTCDDSNLCRMGLNGPMTVTQIMPLVQWVSDGDSFLDIGCGSGTTIDALAAVKKNVDYLGVDIIEHRIEWLKKNYPDKKFQVEDARHISVPDASFDIVWSRHLIDHLGTFEEGMEEQCRIAKKFVICVLWMSLSDLDEHLIKPVIDGDKTYTDEWTNQYSRNLVAGYIADKCDTGWELKEFLENVTWDGSQQGKGRDTIIVLQRL